MSGTITWHGHACFQVQSGNCCNILIDPYFTDNSQAVIGWEDIVKPDIVLVTHLHYDHVGDAVAICKKTGAKLGAIMEAVAELVKQGIPSEQVLNGAGYNIGGSVKVGETVITMTEASHSIGEGEGACTGFIITLPDGYTLYHPGDTGVFSNMAVWGELYPMDLALLPVGDVFTMGGRQAAYAAKLLKTKAAIPMHYGRLPILDQTPDLFLEEIKTFAPQCKAIVMEPGQTIPLP